jgi:hypothetical protein
MHSRFRCSVVPLAALLLAAPVECASAQSISFGLMAGGSLSTFTGDAASDVKNYAGFIAGGFVRLSLAGFAVQPGAYYTMKGAKSSDFSETTGEKTAIDYIEIPIVVRLHMGPIYVGAGPAIGFKLGCKVTLNSGSTAGTSQDCADATTFGSAKSTEFTGIAEAGVEFGKLSIGGRADIGLSNVYEAAIVGSASTIHAKTRTLSAVIAVRF